jgi:hypothetical protein
MNSSGEPKRYEMGEQAEAGPLVYTVLEAEWWTQLGEGVNVRMPQHRLLLLRLSVTNSGATECLIPTMTLVGSGGESYQELSDGEGVDDWLGVLRRLRPTETMHGRVLFDAPRGDYQLRVTDDAFEPEMAQVALVDIPLRFESKPTGPVEHEFPTVR